MALLAALFAVKDVEAYLDYHQGNRELARKHGCASDRVCVDVQDPRTVFLLMEFPTAEAAQAYVDDAIRSGALERSTLEGIPRIDIYEDAPRR
jgi:hypothetical protein